MTHGVAVALLTVIILSYPWITSCGQRVCVAGIGDCSIQKDPNKKVDPLVGDKQFNLTTSKNEIFEGERLEIKAENSSGDWLLQITEGPGKIEKSGSSAIFEAPATVTSSSVYAKLKGSDINRYKSDAETPNAFDTLMIEIKKKNR